MEQSSNSENKNKELISLKHGIISKISHEYRTPLTVIQTSTDLLKIFYQIRDNEKFNDSINKINNSIEKMVKFLEDIVLLGKIESNMIDMNFERVDVVSYIDSILLHYKTSRNDIQEIAFTADGEKKHFTIDLNLISIILNRLLSNAINYSPKDTKILVSLVTTDKNFTLCIEDKGDGIEPEKLKEIFNPYKQFINNSYSSGTGFGLAIVKESIDILNGNIDIQSQKGQGTKVTVKIPDRK